jgi:hypothetical protein
VHLLEAEDSDWPWLLFGARIVGPDADALKSNPTWATLKGIAEALSIPMIEIARQPEKLER